MRDQPSVHEPDIARLVAMVAFASLATMGELALVVSQPIGIVLVASLLPVVFWAILLREIYRLLNSTGSDAPPS